MRGARRCPSRREAASGSRSAQSWIGEAAWSVLQGFQRGTEEFFRRRARRRKAVPQRHGGRRDGKRMPCRGSTRSEEHTSELQSLMRISYAVFCLKNKKPKKRQK